MSSNALNTLSWLFTLAAVAVALFLGRGWPTVVCATWFIVLSLLFSAFARMAEKDERS